MTLLRLIARVLYQSTVLKLLTPFRHGKTPWYILFIPHVKNFLAALTLGETMDRASLCAFQCLSKKYSVLWYGAAGSCDERAMIEGNGLTILRVG